MALALPGVLLAACTDGADEGVQASGPMTFTTPDRAVEAIASSAPAGSALGVSRRLYASAEVVVLAPADDEPAQQAAVRAARLLRAPVLLDARPVRDELSRLDPDVVLAVGDTIDVPDQLRVEADDAAAAAAAERLAQEHGVPEAQDRDVLVMTRAPELNRAAVATARHAGATVVRVPTADPRTTPAAVEALTDRPDAAVIGLGAPFTNGLEYQVASVRDDRQQPGGGYTVFPGRHVVALYGHPATEALGMLGEQGPKASVERVQRLAARYETLADDPVVPAFEIIASVATAGAGPDGDYSATTDPEDLLPLVEAAEAADMYVMIDLQPGRTDFLTQAKEYRALLARPNVGLALDPEWRLRDDEKHLTQIGSVSAKEVNQVGDWLAELTREEGLPQKLFVLHQFSTSMIRDRGDVVTTRPELATVIHVDGQGRPGDKVGTWRTIRAGAQDGIAWGWKNFEDEDEPMLTPERTWRVRPTPDLVTYQ